MRIEPANLSWQEAHDLIGNVIAPLPIAFISTVGPDGTYNAAPFSFVAPVCSKPPIVCVSIGLRKGEKKDTLINIEYSQDFVVNVVDENLTEAVRICGQYSGREIDKFKHAKLTPVKGLKVNAPCIEESPLSLECKVVKQIPTGDHVWFIGEVQSTTIRNDYDWKNGLLFKWVGENGFFYEVGNKVGEY